MTLPQGLASSYHEVLRASLGARRWPVVDNLIGETWSRPPGETLPVHNPATADVIDEVPLSRPDELAVDVAVTQPSTFCRFSGWNGSFFGDLHVQGSDCIDFYTRKKMVVSRR